MPYIVEKDRVKGTYLTQDAESGDTTIYVESISNLAAGAATIYDDDNSEAVTIVATGTHATLGPYFTTLAGLTNAYTGHLSGNVYQSTVALGERAEFDMPIKSQWCKIAQIKIVQLTAGIMDISFEIWEESPIQEGVRTEMHKNVLRRSIALTVIQGGWYGESLVNNLLLYKDRNDPGEEREYNLHCALENQLDGTASDFSVTVKIAEIGELV